MPSGRVSSGRKRTTSAVVTGLGAGAEETADDRLLAERQAAEPVEVLWRERQRLRLDEVPNGNLAFAVDDTRLNDLVVRERIHSLDERRLLESRGEVHDHRKRLVREDSGRILEGDDDQVVATVLAGQLLILPEIRVVGEKPDVVGIVKVLPRRQRCRGKPEEETPNRDIPPPSDEALGIASGERRPACEDSAAGGHDWQAASASIVWTGCKDSAPRDDAIFSDPNIRNRGLRHARVRWRYTNRGRRIPERIMSHCQTRASLARRRGTVAAVVAGVRARDASLAHPLTPWS